MDRKQRPADAQREPARGDRSHILMATVDSLPEPFQILGLVHATTTVPSDAAPTDQLLDMLESEAVRMGADGVIGIRLSQVVVPGASRARYVGRITEHVENALMATAMGTAVCRR
jgi:uncharacterized protein YbjQ (UPF0145 family)